MTKNQKIERSLSVILPIAAALIAFAWISVKRKNPSFDVAQMQGIETIKVVIGIWGTLLGFAITAESILITIKGGDLTDLMVSAGHLKTMLFSFMVTNIILFTCLIIFIPVILDNSWNFYIYTLFTCSATASFFSLAISLFYFIVMLSTVNK